MNDKYTFFKNIFLKSTDLIGIINNKKHFIFINPAFKKKLGYEDEEFMSKPFYEWLHPEDRKKSENVRKNILVKNEEYQNFENRYIAKNGNIVWISWIGWKESDNEAVGIGRDITLIKKNIEEKKEMENKEKNYILSKVGHELRTPLNTIIGFTQLINKNKKLNEIYLQNILNSSKLLLTLINDIINVSEIKHWNNIVLHEEWIDLKEIINICLNTIKKSHINTIKTLKINLITKKIEYFIYADYQRFFESLLNVIINAIKYNKKNGLVIISLKIEESNLHIIIEDTGIGISKDNIEKIFEAFNRIGMEKSKIPGNGLGLAITKELLTKMKLKIKMDSVYGKGSKFSIIIPKNRYKKKTNKNAISIHSIENEKKDFNIKNNKKIIYIEDDLLSFSLVKEILKQYENIQIINFRDGKSGIINCIQNIPDLILLDHKLPDIDGLKVLKILENIDNMCPIISISASNSKYQRELYKKIGCSECITKPIYIDNFLKIILKYLHDI